MVQLKRHFFDQSNGTSHKIGHNVAFRTQLQVAGDNCRLVGVVRHKGNDFAGGHYTAHILSAGQWWGVDGMRNSWLRVEEDAVLDPTDVYVLLYERMRDASVPVGPCMYGRVDW